MFYNRRLKMTMLSALRSGRLYPPGNILVNISIGSWMAPGPQRGMNDEVNEHYNYPFRNHTLEILACSAPPPTTSVWRVFTPGPLRHEWFGEVPQRGFKLYYLHPICNIIGHWRPHGPIRKGSMVTSDYLLKHSIWGFADLLYTQTHQQKFSERFG